MTGTEELIRAALAKQAERAPHPGQIINALAVPRRRRRLASLAVVGALVVIAAVTAPLVFRGSPVTEVVPPATPDIPRVIPMRFAVTDVPPGFRERSRSADLDGGEQARNWMDDGNQALQLAVYAPMSPKWPQLTRPDGEPVRVGGVPGWLKAPANGGIASVSWMPDKDTVLVLLYAGQSAVEQAKRLAGSVRPDGVASVEPPMSFGFLPGRFNQVGVRVFGSSPASGEAWLRATVSGSETASIEARVVPKGTTAPDERTVAVPTADGREVRLKHNVDASVTAEEARRIAEGIKIEQEPDLSWLGS